MAEKRAIGDMELKTVSFTGTIVKNRYAALTNGWENVKVEEVRTWTIRRKVEFDFGERIWDSMLSQFGRLILRCQPENVHALIPLWFEPVKETKKEREEKKVVPGHYPTYIWACDAELYSKYLLKRDELAADHRCYLLEHPDLRALLSDFVQAALLRKPTHLIPFAVNFFESFLKVRPESPSTDESSKSSIETGFGGQEWGGEGWAGEGDEDTFTFHSIRPIQSLEKLVSSEEELLGEGFNSEAEEDVSIVQGEEEE